MKETGRQRGSIVAEKDDEREREREGGERVVKFVNENKTKGGNVKGGCDMMNTLNVHTSSASLKLSPPTPIIFYTSHVIGIPKLAQFHMMVQHPPPPLLGGSCDAGGRAAD